jgi:PAS domain S-box-containing protein
MVGWFTEINELLTIFPSAAYMKFNTALLFFLSAIAVCYKTEANSHKYIHNFIIVFVIAIAIFTSIQYAISFTFNVDNLIVSDTISEITPGRMSLGTGICFALLGFGLLNLNLNTKQSILTAQTLFLIVAIIAYISITSFVLLLQSNDKTLVFNTMSIHTSVLFLLLAIAASLKNYNTGFIRYFNARYIGSKILKRVLPLIILLPMLLGSMLIWLYNLELIGVSFGIVFYCVSFTLLGVNYITHIAAGLNLSDEKRKRLEDHLRSKNRELEEFKTGIDKVAIISITDRNGIIKYVNDAFCEISEYSHEELIGSNHTLVDSGYHDHAFFENIKTTVNKGLVWLDDIKNKSKSNKEYWVNTAIIPSLDCDGNITEYLNIKIDITQRKEAEALLKSKYVQQLEKNNRELEQFAYVASHDLQEPLRTVTSFSDLLYNDYYHQLDDTAKTSLDFIKESTSRMQLLIKGLLDYSKLGKEYDLEVVDLNKIVDNCVADLNHKIDATSAKITKTDLPVIDGYTLPLQLLFQNIISNALKFTKLNVPPEIHVCSYDKGEFWEIQISDNGIGIADKHKKRVFAIFQRLHLNSEYEGTGIGLAHCQRIIEMHKGEISIESEINQGSTFIFTIKKQLP